ncbi:MAG: hypothetical protein ACQEXJ_23870 [Myxococcota bacterium]
MSRRPPGGPIRRRAGDRKRDRDKDRRPRERGAEGTGSGEGAGEEEGVRGPEVIRRPARRVFEPGGGKRRGSPGGGSGSPRVRKGKGGRPPAQDGKSKPKSKPKDAAKDKEQAEAQKLAQDKGIPPVHALRIVRGEVTLNEVLKALMRKERAQRLVERDGLDPGLAGQVASGHLSRERARIVQRIRAHRTHRIDRDILKVAEIEDAQVAVLAFGADWRVGRVVDARTYEIDFRPAEAGEEGAEVIQKHDVKAVCAPEDVERVRAATEVDGDVKAQELGGTADRGERVRPKDVLLLDCLEGEREVRCVLRDGQVIRGVVRAFGRWDMDLEVAGGARVTLLFHALHPATDWGGDEGD